MHFLHHIAQWGPWSSWALCSKGTCGEGFRVRKRKCVVGVPGKDCPGVEEQIAPCDGKECPKRKWTSKNWRKRWCHKISPLQKHSYKNNHLPRRDLLLLFSISYPTTADMMAQLSNAPNFAQFWDATASNEFCMCTHTNDRHCIMSSPAQYTYGHNASYEAQAHCCYLQTHCKFYFLSILFN